MKQIISIDAHESALLAAAFWQQLVQDLHDIAQKTRNRLLTCHVHISSDESDDQVSDGDAKACK